MTVATNKERIDKLEKMYERLAGIVVGNGARGMDEVVRDTEKEIAKLNERMDALENAMGITNSELNHFRNVYFLREGLDAMGNVKEASTWLKRAWNKTTENLFDKFITAVIIIVILNIPDIIEKFVSLAK